MNKFFRIITTVLLITSLICAYPSVLAEAEDVKLITPADGDRISLNSLNAKIYLSEDITGASLWLDGDRLSGIELSEGVVEYDIPFTVESIGDHKMMLIAKGSDGIVSDVASFTVYGEIEETVKDYGFSEPSSLEYYIAQNLGGGVAGFAKRSLTSDSEGTERWATVTFKARDGGNDPIFIRYAGNMLSGQIKLYVRMKAMQTNESFMIRLEGIGDITVLGKDGKIGTSDELYKADKWYDVYVNVNTKIGVCDTYAGDILADSRSFSADGFKAVRLYMSGNNNDNAQYMIDTFRINRFDTTPTVQNVVSITGDSENNGVLADADKIRIYFDSLPEGTEVDAQNISVYSGNTQIAVADATSDKNGDFIDITAHELSENTEYTVFIDIDAFYSDKSMEIPFSVSFKTLPGGFAAEDFGFFSGETKLLTSEFINPGDTVGAYASIVNRTADDKTATLVICSYEGDSLTAISAKSVDVPADSYIPVEIKTEEIAYPSGDNSYMRASIINSWASPYAVVAPIDLE